MQKIALETRLKALTKLATLGDVINAGYGSMGMGSPFVPRPYKPGTDTLKDSDQLNREAKNSVMGAAAGAAISAYPPSLKHVIPYLCMTDMAGGVYSSIHPREGTRTAALNQMDDYVNGMRAKAHREGARPSDNILDDIAINTLGFGGSNYLDNVDAFLNSVNKPMNLVERMKNPELRHAVDRMRLVPLVGSGIDFATNYDANKKSMPSWKNVLKSTLNALPGYRYFANQG